MTAALALNAKRDCGGKPIFASGSDVPSATDHDIEALATWPAWVALNYRAASETPGSRKWYESETECLTPAPGQACDEYPFWATMQGGPPAAQRPHLKLIDSSENSNQGGHYGRFVLNCHMSTGDAFLGIPLASDLGVVTQTGICNGH